ncbi:MAG TPA: methionyl-tRNA formyltransferase [Flavobacterium sp.]|nr:methionyl-tRNA formyltransferase [Flavobacterium sp.]
MDKLRIVFMGTPEFAVGILATIIKSGHQIVGVITAADKPAGRGQQIKHSAVKEFALTHNLKLLQPVSLKDDAFLAELRSLDANLQVVVAFRMLPEVVWRMPKYGTFNLHASLLPEYRGAAPINWAIINGESKTGVTTFFIDDKIDTGEIIYRLETPISPDENAGMLHDRLMELGSLAVVKTLEMIATESVETQKQPLEGEMKSAYKLNRDNCRINWDKPIVEIYNLIRGLSPYPAAWTTFFDNGNQWDVKIYESEIITEQHKEPSGRILTTKKELKIFGIDGSLNVKLLQLPGKKKMTVAELLNGFTFSDESTAR